MKVDDAKIAQSDRDIREAKLKKTRSEDELKNAEATRDAGLAAADEARKQALEAAAEEKRQNVEDARRRMDKLESALSEQKKAKAETTTKIAKQYRQDSGTEARQKKVKLLALLKHLAMPED